MFPSADNRPTDRDSQQDLYQRAWPSIVRIIILEILLLLALSGAFVFYLNWSSEAALSEFMAGGGQPLQAAKDRPPCDHSA
jgi:LPS O-antigen subunit length determinant protein (WzzB/FepE family)